VRQAWTSRARAHFLQVGSRLTGPSACRCPRPGGYVRASCDKGARRAIGRKPGKCSQAACSGGYCPFSLLRDSARRGVSCRHEWSAHRPFSAVRCRPNRRLPAPLDRRGAGPAAGRRGPRSPDSQVHRAGRSSGRRRGRRSVAVRSGFGLACRNSLSGFGACENKSKNRPVRFGIGSVRRAPRRAKEKAPCGSSACGPRHPLSAVLKIRVSAVRFCPWPPPRTPDSHADSPAAGRPSGADGGHHRTARNRVGGSDRT